MDELGEGTWKDGGTTNPRAQHVGKLWQPCDWQPPGMVTLTLPQRGREGKS